MNDHLPDATKMVLSPAAQAVDRAIADRIQLLGEIAPSRQVAAAALRAAALYCKHDSAILMSLADELEVS